MKAKAELVVVTTVTLEAEEARALRGVLWDLAGSGPGVALDLLSAIGDADDDAAALLAAVERAR